MFAHVLCDTRYQRLNISRATLLVLSHLPYLRQLSHCSTILRYLHNQRSHRYDLDVETRTVNIYNRIYKYYFPKQIFIFLFLILHFNIEIRNFELYKCSL